MLKRPKHTRRWAFAQNGFQSIKKARETTQGERKAIKSQKKISKEGLTDRQNKNPIRSSAKKK
jgi:hypothetical protein